MSQNWDAILNTDNVSDSFAPLMARLDTLRSNWAGATAPASFVAGQIFYDSDDDKSYQRTTGGSWARFGRAPEEATYIVQTLHTDLSGERALSDTTTVSWDFGTSGAAKANIVAGSIVFSLMATAAVSDDATLAGASHSKLVTEYAAKTYADQITAANDAMVFKGSIDASANPNYPAADRGHSYRISVAGKIGGASGTNVEAGDLITCLTDGTSAGDQATVGTSWSIGQANIDGAVVGPSSATADGLVRFNGVTGKLIKDGGTLVLSDFAAAIITYAKIQNVSATNRILARFTAGAGSIEEASLGADHEFSGGALRIPAFTGDITKAAGSLATSIGANKVLDSMLRQGAALSVIGVTGNAIANVADIVAGTDGHVLRRNGTALSFGTLIAASYADNTIVAARLAITGQYKIVGRSSASAGAGEEISSSSAVFTFLGSADQAAMRTNMALGTAAVATIGTSGDTVPKNNTANNFSAALTLSGGGQSLILTSATNPYLTATDTTNGHTAIMLANDNGIYMGSLTNSNADVYANNNFIARFTPGGGFMVGAPTGGDKGPGTGNFTAVYDDNVLLTCFPVDMFKRGGKFDAEEWHALVPNREHPDEFIFEEQEVEIPDPSSKAPSTIGKLLGRKQKMVRRTVMKKRKGRKAWTEERSHPIVPVFEALMDRGLDPHSPDYLENFVRIMREDGAVPGMMTKAEWMALIEADQKPDVGTMHSRMMLGVDNTALAVAKAFDRIAALEAQAASQKE